MMSIKQDRGAKTTQQQDKQAFATFDDQPKLGKGGYLKPVCKVSYSTTLFLLVLDAPPIQSAHQQTLCMA